MQTGVFLGAYYRHSVQPTHPLVSIYACYIFDTLHGRAWLRTGSYNAYRGTSWGNYAQDWEYLMQLDK